MVGSLLFSRLSLDRQPKLRMRRKKVELQPEDFSYMARLRIMKEACFKFYPSLIVTGCPGNRRKMSNI